MIKYNLICLTTAFGLTLSAACTSDSASGESGGEGVAARITGSIGTATVVETKATVGNGDDISYNAFVVGDKIGFFSATGLEAENAELTYNSYSFQRPDGADALIWKEGVAQKVYAYYPYSTVTLPVTGSEYPVSVWRAGESNKWNDGFEDFLAASGNNVPNGSLISLNFSHQFAMLIIKRGEGFDTNTSDIKVRLNYPVAHTANICRAEWPVTLRLQVDETGTSELTATQGTYTVAGSSGTGVDCAYVIIPVGGIYKDGVKQTAPLTVASVVLENNAGNEVTVPFALSSVAFKANTKYSVTVKMRDNRAVIEPEEIRRWEDETIEVIEPAGIKTAEEFEIWLSTYNQPSFPGRLDILNRYGTFDGSTNKWIFLLLNDIDNTATLSNTVITEFKDVFDGQGHTVSGLSLTGDGNVGFFGMLSGEVKNLKLHNIRVAKGTSSTSTDNFGALAGTLTNTGKISNCHVTGDASFVVGAGNTGGLAGFLNASGSITDCTSTAVVRGTDAGTTDLLVGKNDGGTVTGCTSTGTLITNN